ncbi:MULTISPECIES: hypothetical protein [unclassified Clostridium]|uniref:hypothetical protein n=1 Tax=unclassified Clostridium TaxID=2614128 RepID=UPI00321771F8
MKNSEIINELKEREYNREMEILQKVESVNKLDEYTEILCSIGKTERLSDAFWDEENRRYNFLLDNEIINSDENVKDETIRMTLNLLRS